MINFCVPPPAPVGARKEVAGRVDSPSSQTTSRFGGAVGPALLMAVLFALVLGVYGAVYIDAFRPATMQPRLPATAMPSVTASPVTPAAQPPSRSVAIPLAPTPAHSNAAADRSTPAPAEAIEPPYWVEYGAYRGVFYAAKLVERLDAAGLKAEIKRVRGAAGRVYFSVRSASTTDRAGAAASAKIAAARTGIVPLVHRGDGAALARPIMAKLAAHTPAARADGSYWVQFGAYDLRGYAVALRDRLQRAGVNAALVERHIRGHARYLVRSAAPLQRANARSMAARAGSALGITPLVGQAWRASHSAT